MWLSDLAHLFGELPAYKEPHCGCESLVAGRLCVRQPDVNWQSPGRGPWLPEIGSLFVRQVHKPWLHPFAADEDMACTHSMWQRVSDPRHNRVKINSKWRHWHGISHPAPQASG